MGHRFSSASPPGLGGAVGAAGPAYTNRTLSGRVPLDGASFERCRFRRATLVYSGGAPPRIEGCAFEAVTFEFEGAAGRTLALLNAMAAPSSGLRDVFKASFPTIFGH